MAESVTAYTIRNSKLVDTVGLFRTKKEILNAIDIEFDFFSVVDWPTRPLQLIAYDEEKKKLYIPYIEGYGQVTKRNLVYQLKGKYFEYVGIESKHEK